MEKNEEQIIEYTENEIVGATNYSTELYNIIRGENKKITDNLKSVVETLDGLSDCAEKSLSGYTKISNIILIEFIMEILKL